MRRDASRSLANQSLLVAGVCMVADSGVFLLGHRPGGLWHWAAFLAVLAIDAALARHGVEWTWHNLVLPVFEAICRRQAETGAGVEIEHLFSERLLGALTRIGRPPARPVNDRPVLLACAENELHSM
ncbi:hypothetical protein ACFQ08_35640, partial [Streptosporangium algeriense]